jgi:hypothetical protein
MFARETDRCSAQLNVSSKRNIRTLEDARTFVLEVQITGIFAPIAESGTCLWDVTDLPEKNPNGKGWGPRVTAVWKWKNELPQTFPDEFFYGKAPKDQAVLMTLPYLQDVHYPRHHRPPSSCSAMARALLEEIRLEPMTTGLLRKALDASHPPRRNAFARALTELQVTLNIVRRNDPLDKQDTWVLFSEEYLDIVRQHA